MSGPAQPEEHHTDFGPYRLVALIGRGGMGEVFRAHDTRRDRTVAIKRLIPEIAEDPEIRGRFERECRTIARLASPHIVPIHDFGVIDGHPFLDMRLLEGRNLGGLLRDEGPLEPHRAVDIVLQVADALDDAHRHGLVHRDVKPANILITTASTGDFVHLVDFGIVRLVQDGKSRSLTESGAVIGTLTHMAPEQFSDEPIDRRADVYALTVVLYELLTGKPPFTGDMASLLKQHLNDPPVPPSALRPLLPRSLDSVTERGLAKEPTARYASAGELAAAAKSTLDRKETGRGTPHGLEAHRPTEVNEVATTQANEGRRYTRFLWPALGALLLLVVVAAAALTLGRSEDAQALVALGPGSDLRQQFSDAAAGCRPGSPASFRISRTGVAPDAVLTCTRGTQLYVALEDWPEAVDAEARVEGYRSSSVDAQSNWSINGAPQGSYVLGRPNGQCNIVAAYEGLPLSIQVYSSAPDEGCARTKSAFDALAPPSGDSLRDVESVIPAANPSGCGPPPTDSRVSSATPRQARTCIGPEGATVTYTRWNSPVDAAQEVAARRAAGGGGAASWAGQPGVRQGASVEVEASGSCSILLSWDAAPYSAELVTPACETSERALTALQPPPGDTLPPS